MDPLIDAQPEALAPNTLSDERDCVPGPVCVAMDLLRELRMALESGETLPELTPDEEATKASALRALRRYMEF